MTRWNRRGGTLLIALLAAGATSAAAATPFRFDLDNEYTTSAGVFDGTGRLVRTLWSARRLGIGPHAEDWDGLDDDGSALSPQASYEIRVLTHNLVYTWQGVAGNSTPDSLAPWRHTAPQFLGDLQIAAGRAYFTSRWEGALPAMRYLELGRPDSWYPRPGTPIAYGYPASVGLIAVDGKRVYWAHDSSEFAFARGHGGDQSFVIATDPDVVREVPFANGVATCVRTTEAGCYHDGAFDARIASAIDVVADESSTAGVITGLAVQPDGALLLVGRAAPGGGRLDLLDKESGRRLAVLPLAGVGRLVFGRNGQLFAIHASGERTTVTRFRLRAAPDFALVAEVTLDGLDSPLALALTPDGTEIVVADGGQSQQVKGYDARTGERRWTLGQPGGYRTNGPVVTPDKFSFRRFDELNGVARAREVAMIAYAPDGSLWLGDAGTSRILVFDHDRSLQRAVSFLPSLYAMAVDRRNPARVFAGFSEYRVDYSGPLAESWELVRYYGDAFPEDGGYHARSGGFTGVVTVDDGRTLASVRRSGGAEIVELPDAGDPRRVDPLLDVPAFLAGNGDLIGAREEPGGRIVLWRRALHDVAGTPRWDVEQTTGRVTRGQRDPRINPYGGNLSQFVAALEDGTTVLLDPKSRDAVAPTSQPPFHLGAVRRGGSGWQWRASPEAGAFRLEAPDGRFDARRPWYAGMSVQAAGDQLVYNYHGEGWLDGGAAEANQFLHWNRDGLFIGQFGVPREPGIAPGSPGVAGNSFAFQLVMVNGATYLYHNDESVHGGIHRWLLDGAAGVRELTGRGRIGSDFRLTAAVRDPGPPAPQNLAVFDVGGAGLWTRPGGDPLLTWSLPRSLPSDREVLEVQRLNPTLTGRRFEAIARLPPNATSYLDTLPLPGEPTEYRVRLIWRLAASTYSNHVAFTSRGGLEVIDAGRFETGPRGLRDDFHLGSVEGRSVEMVRDRGVPTRVLHIRERPTPGVLGDRARVRYTASPALYRSLERSLARPRGTAADLYRIDVRWRPVFVRLGRESEAIVSVDPGFPLFATSGRRSELNWIAPAAEWSERSEYTSTRATFVAFPNGLERDALANFGPTPVAPEALSIVLSLRLSAPTDVVDAMVEGITVAKSVPAVNELAPRDDDGEPARIADPALERAIRERVGRPTAVLTQRDLRSLAWLPLRGTAVRDLSGIERAVNLVAIDLEGTPVRYLAPLSKLTRLRYLRTPDGTRATANLGSAPGPGRNRNQRR
jgi:hypothetical protein